MAMISALNAGAHIAPHCGVHNFRITAHQLTDAQVAELLSRLRRPDVPGLAALVYLSAPAKPEAVPVS